MTSVHVAGYLVYWFRNLVLVFFDLVSKGPSGRSHQQTIGVENMSKGGSLRGEPTVPPTRPPPPLPPPRLPQQSPRQLAPRLPPGPPRLPPPVQRGMRPMPPGPAPPQRGMRPMPPGPARFPGPFPPRPMYPHYGAVGVPGPQHPSPMCK